MKKGIGAVLAVVLLVGIMQSGYVFAAGGDSDEPFLPYAGTGDLSIRIDAAGSDLVGVVSYGHKVDQESYLVEKAESGDEIKLIFEKAYLRSLPVGNYGFNVNFSDGSSELIRIRIEQSSRGQTGAIYVWLTVSILSAASALCAYLILKKNRTSNG